jgi:curved DNA-binding protein CbpA
MLIASDREIRVDLEGKVLVAALRQSVEQGDQSAADFAHKQLFQLLRGQVRPKPKQSKMEKNVYEILGLKEDASEEVVHKHFLHRVRKLLLGKAKEHPMQFLQQLRSLWIAHDILIDPATRRDYDRRIAGLPLINEPMKDSEKSNSENSINTQLEANKIVKLIESSGLMEQTELDIARDMHRAMPEMPFADFLIKQNFIERQQLDAIMTGGRLLQSGTISPVQFKKSIKDLSEAKSLTDGASNSK